MSQTNRLMDSKWNRARAWRARAVVVAASAFLWAAVAGAVDNAVPENGSGASDAEPSVDDVKAAAVAFDSGRAAFKDDDYGVAAEHFERADALVPNAKVLLLAIQSRNLAGQLARAATLAALATQRYPKDERFADTEELLRRARSELHRVKITCDPPCSVLVGTRLVPGRPASTRFVFVESGPHRIRAVFADGESETRDYLADAGTSGTLDFSSSLGTANPLAGYSDAELEQRPSDAQSRSAELSSEPGAPGPDQQSPAASGLPPLVFWSGVVATGALTGVSIWSGVDTQNNPGPERVKDECPPEEGEDCALYKLGLQKQTRTNVLWAVTAGVGVLTAVVGGFWTHWGGSDTVKDQGRLRPRVTPWISVGRGATIGAQGRF